VCASAVRKWPGPGGSGLGLIQFLKDHNWLSSKPIRVVNHSRALQNDICVYRWISSVNLLACRSGMSKHCITKFICYVIKKLFILCTTVQLCIHRMCKGR
jgi:hypothetical protein